MGLRVIWFDFGGVLSPPINELFTAYFHKTGITPKALQAAIKKVADDMGVPTLAPIENALLTEYEWGRRVRTALSEMDSTLDMSKARLETFGEQWFAGIAPNATMVAAFKQCKAAGFKVGILTNNVVEWQPYWRRMIDLDSVTDYLLDSCKEGCRKPDAAFFALAEQRAGVQARQCLLIDDLQENCDAAAQRGWHTLHFTDNAVALQQLQQILREEQVKLCQQ